MTPLKTEAPKVKTVDFVVGVETHQHRNKPCKKGDVIQLTSYVAEQLQAKGVGKSSRLGG